MGPDNDASSGSPDRVLGLAELAGDDNVLNPASSENMEQRVVKKSKAS